jgi:putative ABC transport system permease protein
MAILQRRRDLAIMRALGATRGEIFGAVLIEAFWVTLLGLAAGWALGVLTCKLLGLYLATRLGFHIAAVSLSADLITAYSAVLLMGLIAGILPAWQAYRTDIARDLAEP